MMPCRIRGGDVRILRIPLKNPFITALGRKDSTRNAALRLRLAGGAEGYGEASGSVVNSRQSPRRLAATLRRMLTHFHGRDAAALGPLTQEAWSEFGHTPAAAAAFECAATEAVLAAHGVPMASWFGGSRDRIETDCTLSADTAQRTADAARTAARMGFRVLKVKVGRGGIRADLARVLAADEHGRRRNSRPKLILDGNQKLTLSGTLRLVERCLKAGAKIVLVEQPLPRTDLKGMARLTMRSPVLVAADESLRSAADALRLAEMNAADVFNVKVAKTGLQESLRIIAVARAAKKKLMIGCMQESARGLSPSVHLACGAGVFDFVDLDSDYLLADVQPRGGFTRDGAVLSL